MTSVGLAQARPTVRLLNFNLLQSINQNLMSPVPFVLAISTPSA